MWHPLPTSEAVALTLGMGRRRGKEVDERGNKISAVNPEKWEEHWQELVLWDWAHEVKFNGLVRYEVTCWEMTENASLHLRLISKQHVWQYVTLKNTFLLSTAISLRRGWPISLSNLYHIFQLIMTPPSQFPRSTLWIITGCWSSDPNQGEQ